MTFTALPLRMSLVALLAGGGTIAAAHMAQKARVEAVRPITWWCRRRSARRRRRGDAELRRRGQARRRAGVGGERKRERDAGAGGGVPDPKSTPSFRHGALDGPACQRELAARGIVPAPAKRELAPGVDVPLTLVAALRGVEVRGVGQASQRSGATYSVLDCRLALALDDFAALLARRDVVAIEHLCMHRPRAAKATGKPSQHELGLAIDAAAFVKRDGTRLEVKRDWRGRIGAAPCTPVAAEGPAAAELRAIVCEARSAGLFTVMLTPNANAQHADHLHLDLTRDATWSLLE
ncbi:MAG: extensin family protein [Polyangiaceae bacterium]